MNLMRRSGLLLSYVVSCNGTSPLRVLFWILMSLVLFIWACCLLGGDVFTGVWYFLTMDSPDSGNPWLSMFAAVDGLIGVLLTAEFISVSNNNRW